MRMCVVLGVLWSLLFFILESRTNKSKIHLAAFPPLDFNTWWWPHWLTLIIQWTRNCTRRSFDSGAIACRARQNLCQNAKRFIMKTHYCLFPQKKLKPWTSYLNLNRSTVVSHVVLTMVTMKGTIFWYVTPCSLVEVYREFRGTYALHYLRYHGWILARLIVICLLAWSFLQPWQRQQYVRSKLNKSSIRLYGVTPKAWLFLI
jgi:hypothetical protein